MINDYNIDYDNIDENEILLLSTKELEDIVKKDRKDLIKLYINKKIEDIKEKELNLEYEYITEYNNFKNIWELDYDENEKIKLQKKITEEFKIDFNRYFKISSSKEVALVCVNPDLNIENELNSEDEYKYHLKKVIVDEHTFNLILNDNFKIKIDKKLKSASVIQRIFENASLQDATDIYIKYIRGIVQVFFRIDESTKEYGVTFDSEDFNSILRTLKEMSGFSSESVDVEIKGKIQMDVFNKKKEYRLSIQDLVNGVSISIRVLAELDKNKTFSSLGYFNEDKIYIENLLYKKDGIIYFVGETGSGKTTSLNLLLLEHHKMFKKQYGIEKIIRTIEDPVEIEIFEFMQTQISEVDTWQKKIALNLRQKPDIILIGETRDLETISATKDSALSGHLTLSTFHANNSLGTLKRLQEKLSTTNKTIGDYNNLLKCIIAQSLEPSLCSCKLVDENNSKLLQKEFDDNEIIVYKRNEDGCSICKDRPIKGQIGKTLIYELTIFKDEYIGSYIENFNDSYSYYVSKKEIAFKKMLNGDISYDIYKKYIDETTIF